MLLILFTLLLGIRKVCVQKVAAAIFPTCDPLSSLKILKYIFKKDLWSSQQVLVDESCFEMFAVCCARCYHLCHILSLTVNQRESHVAERKHRAIVFIIVVLGVEVLQWISCREHVLVCFVEA